MVRRVTSAHFPALRTGMVNLLYAPAEIKGFTQRAHKRFIMTDCFTGAVGKFSHRLSVTLHKLDHDIERFYLRDIAGQAGTDAEA